MSWIKNHDGNIEAIVTKNTGMSLRQLLNDEHEYVYPNLAAAADLFLAHVKKGSKIVVYGDYDADGVTSLAELTILCRSLKFAGVTFIAPRRFSDGYGLNVNRVNEFISKRCDLLVTIDNGIAALDAINLAKVSGMDVIVLDHHEQTRTSANEVRVQSLTPQVVDGKAVLPNANVICDPHVTGGDDTFGFDDLCGAGIGLHFAEYILKQYNSIADEEKHAILDELYVLAAIGTVADVVKLSFDNRRIVKRGLELINAGKGTTGLNMLLNTLNIEHVDSETIGFSIAPVINAIGRLYDDGAEKMVRLLTSEEETIVLEDLCTQAKLANDIRKRMTEEAVLRAKDEVKPDENTRFIIYVDNSGALGIAGLIAAKLANDFKLPAICLMKVPDNDGGYILKGSGRTYGDINILDAVSKCSDLLLGFGGHKEALGLSLKPEKLKALKGRLDEVTPEVIVTDDISYDLDINDMKLGKSLWGIVNEIKQYEPYGAGNPKLICRISDMKLGDKYGNTYKVMGKNSEHLKLIGADLNVLYFNGAAKYKALGAPKTVSAIGTLGINVFNGKRSLQLQAIDIC